MHAREKSGIGSSSNRKSLGRERIERGREREPTRERESKQKFRVDVRRKESVSKTCTTTEWKACVQRRKDAKTSEVRFCYNSLSPKGVEGSQCSSQELK